MKLAYHRIIPVAQGPYIDLLCENICGAKRPDTVVGTKGPHRASEAFQFVYRSLQTGCLMASPILVKNEEPRVKDVPESDVVSVAVKLAEFMYEMSRAGLPILGRSDLYKGPGKNLVDEVRAMFASTLLGNSERQTG